ncbi:MAG TPA: hypothetical protein VLN59_03230, partial [Burkholderiales bacterium]|nr:hypothetical protein [Burkholderiales bacterium]
MSAKTPISKAAAANGMAGDVNREANAAIGVPLAAPAAPRLKLPAFAHKPKKDPGTADGQDAGSQAAGETPAEPIVLAQANLMLSDVSSLLRSLRIQEQVEKLGERRDASSTADNGRAVSESGAAGSGGTSLSGVSQDAASLPTQPATLPDAAPTAGGASDVVAAVGVGSAAAVAGGSGGGFSPLLALPLVGLGAGGGGGGGASAARSAPTAPAAPTAPSAPTDSGTTTTPTTPSTPSTLAPVVVKGIVADGYVAGAKLYIDVNGNGNPDAGEDTGVVTDRTGHFSLSTSLHGALIAVGGTNIDTGLANTLVLMAPQGSTVVNPLTTLVQQYVHSKGVSVATAETAVQTQLALPNVDLQNYDPLAAASPTDDTALAVQKAAAQLAVITTLSEKYSAGVASSIIQSVVDLIHAGHTIDLTAVADLNTINTNSGVALTTAQIENIAAGTTAIAQDTTLASGATGSVGESQLPILTVLTVAEAKALQQTSPAAKFSLFDTAAHVLAADAATVNAATGGVTLSDQPTLLVADATVLQDMHAHLSYSLTDTAANLASASVAVGNGATSITATDIATVAQAVAIEAVANMADCTYTIADTAAHLLAADATVLADAAAVTVTDATSVANADALLALNPHTAFALSDTVANLLLPADAPAVGKADAVTVLDSVTVAEANALHALNADVTYGLSDIAANLLSVPDAATIGAANTVMAIDAMTVAEADTLLGINSRVSYSVADNAANLLALADAATVS